MKVDLFPQGQPPVSGATLKVVYNLGPGIASSIVPARVSQELRPRVGRVQALRNAPVRLPADLDAASAGHVCEGRLQGAAGPVGGDGAADSPSTRGASLGFTRGQPTLEGVAVCWRTPLRGEA